MIEISSIDLYENRILIFLEISPQSNKYNQVVLTFEEFKNMTATISKKTGKMLAPTVEEVLIETNKTQFVLPDLPSHV